MYIEGSRNPHPLGCRKRIRAWRMGFLSGSYLWRDLDHHDPRAAHGFGGGGRMVDDVSQGGVEAGQPRYIESHPDTGARITPVQIPHWQQVVDRVLALAWERPYMPIALAS